MARGDLIFNQDTLSPKLRTLTTEIHEAVTAAFEFHATRAEAAMRQGARWTDRTGNARNGLRVSTSHSPVQHVMVLYHAMPYGIWLELRWSGRYAIIGPTMQTTSPALTSTIIAALARLGV